MLFRKGLMMVVVPRREVDVNRPIGEFLRVILEGIDERDYAKYDIQQIRDFSLCGGYRPALMSVEELAKDVEELAKDVEEPQGIARRVVPPPIFGGKHTLPIAQITDEHLNAVEAVVFYRVFAEELASTNGLTPAEKLRKIFPDDFAVLVDADIEYPYQC